MTEQVQIEANDMINALQQMLANANRELALAVARGEGLLRKVAELEKETPSA